MPLCLHRLCLLEANDNLRSHFVQVYGSIRREGAFIYVFFPLGFSKKATSLPGPFPWLGGGAGSNDALTHFCWKPDLTWSLTEHEIES